MPRRRPAEAGREAAKAAQTRGMRLRDATPSDLPVIAGLIRALADYERLSHEVEWTEEGFERAGDGRVEWAVLDWNEPSIAFYDRQGARPVPGWTRYRWRRNA